MANLLFFMSYRQIGHYLVPLIFDVFKLMRRMNLFFLEVNRDSTWPKFRERFIAG